MENQEKLKKAVPSSIILGMNLAHLGKILFCYALIGVLFLVATLLTPLLYIFYALFAILAVFFIIVFTIGIILLEPTIIGQIFQTIQNFGDFINVLLSLIPIVTPVTLGLSGLSLILLLCDKHNVSWVRFAFNIVFIVISLFFLLFQVGA